MPRIAIVTENPSDSPLARFSSGNSAVLKGLLAQVGIENQDVRFHSVLKSGSVSEILVPKPLALGGYPPVEKGKYFPLSQAGDIAAMFNGLRLQAPNVIIAMGATPLWALTKHTGIAKWRGTPCLSPEGGWKVIPTWAPGSIIKQWELRPIVFMDMAKAVRHAESPTLSRPLSYIHLEPSPQDIEDFYNRYIVPAPFLSVDIETKAGTITEIGFAVSPKRALVIPFWSRARGNYWSTAADEKKAWLWVKRILSEKPSIGQNFQYDMQYLWRTMGIPIPKFAGDTMLLHHALQPEMKKGLGFLASVYTDRPQWKSMRADAETLKREDD